MAQELGFYDANIFGIHFQQVPILIDRLWPHGAKNGHIAVRNTEVALVALWVLTPASMASAHEPFILPAEEGVGTSGPSERNVSTDVYPFIMGLHL